MLGLLLTLELGVRGYDWWRGEGFFANFRNPLRLELFVLPFRGFGPQLYQSGPGGERLIANRLGETFPYEKPAGTFRIVCLGGSTTENANAMRHFGVHYPGELAKKLKAARPEAKIEVINQGFAGYTTPHLLILLALDVLSWNPDLLIVSENVNDLLTAYFPGFVPDYSHKFGTRYYVRNLELLENFTPLNLLCQHFQLYWIVKDRLARLAGPETPPDTTIRTRSYGPEPPAEARAVFVRNLRSLVALARENGIPVILGTQPLEPSREYWLRHMAYKPYNELAVYPLQEEFVAHHQSYNRALREVAAATGSPLVDNERIFGGRRELFVDFVHYTAAGVDRLATDYADHILAQGLLDHPLPPREQP